MTCIAVKITKERISIASDSQSSDKEKGTKSLKSKKIHVFGDLVYCNTGSVEEKTMFLEYLKSHKPEKATELSVFRFIRDFKSWVEENTCQRRYKIKNNMFLIFQGKVFYVCQGSDVSEIKNYLAIGSGSREAMSAMYLGHEPEEATKAAVEFCLTCGGDIITHEIKL